MARYVQYFVLWGPDRSHLINSQSFFKRRDAEGFFNELSPRYAKKLTRRNYDKESYYSLDSGSGQTTDAQIAFSDADFTKTF